MVGEKHPSGVGSLAEEVRRRLGPPPSRAEWPLVSIIVLNRDGAGHLRRLLAGLVERTDYPDFELIVVDNGSSDDSLLLTIWTLFRQRIWRASWAPLFPA